MSRPSPLPNRVDPFGALFATPARGLFLGIRGGQFHREDRTLGARRWASRRWICCLTSFKGRRREVWGPGYTQLFFLDEVTALAAGHRPCAECRRPAFRAFLTAAGYDRADALDMTLDRERREGRAQRRHVRLAADVPQGAVIVHDGMALARRFGRLFRWTPAAWVPDDVDLPSQVEVLTPPTTLAALSAGYAPAWHPSAG